MKNTFDILESSYCHDTDAIRVGKLFYVVIDAPYDRDKIINGLEALKAHVIEVIDKEIEKVKSINEPV